MCLPSPKRRIDKSRSAWTNASYRNDTSGVKAFLAAEFRQITKPYVDPSIYQTELLPQQYNPFKEKDENAIHMPDLVDVRRPRSLTGYGKTLETARKIPPWDNSPLNVVQDLLWRKSEPIR